MIGMLKAAIGVLIAVPWLLKAWPGLWDVESCAWDVCRGASAIESLAWAVVGDVWHVDGRGRAVARFNWRWPGLLTALLWMLMACAYDGSVDSRAQVVGKGLGGWQLCLGLGC